MPGILPIIETLDDIAEAIANPNPDRPISDAIGAAGRKICDAASNAPEWMGVGRNVAPAIGLVCGPYWAKEGIDPPIVEPAFPGGQCETGYLVTVRGRNIDAVPPEWFSPVQLFVSGPVTIGKQSPTDPICDDPARPNKGNARLENGDGSVVTILAFGCFDVPDGYEILEIVRADGLPDDCGDPPGEVKPGPNPSPRNPVIPPDEQPYNDPIRGPVIPIPDIPTMPGFPDIPLPDNPFGVGGGNEPEPNGVGEPGTPQPTGDAPGSGAGSGGGEAEGEAPEGKELVGLLLNLISALPNSGDYGDGVYRAGAYIRMGTPVGLDQDFGGSQIEDGQFFFAERDGLTKWRVTANVGLNWLITPYYREV